jgi:hypothetical protein
MTAVTPLLSRHSLPITSGIRCLIAADFTDLQELRRLSYKLLSRLLIDN